MYPNIEHIKNQYMIMEHPKCGRTWLNALLRTSVSKEYDIDLSGKTSLVMLNHDGQALKNRKDDYIRSGKYDDNKSIIFLVRDPRDVMVSFYFAVKRPYRVHLFPYGNISEFIRSKFGIEHMMKFLNDWSVILSNKKDSMWISYENMQADTMSVLTDCLGFIGIDVSVKSMRFAIEKCSFDKMQKDEMKQSEVANREQLQIRRGKIGGYVDYLKSNDIDYINHMMRQYKCYLIEDYL
jgi:hypothetical protein